MFKPLVISLSLAGSIVDYPKDKQFVFDGDYTDVAQEYLDKNKSKDSFDPNEILYNAIIKEILENGLSP
jgi:hypothetical protein